MKTSFIIMICCLLISAPAVPVLSQIDCRESIANLDRSPVRIDTLALIDPETYDLEYFLKFIYIDEVGSLYNRPDKIITAKDREIPRELTEKKNDQLIFYVLQDSCYKIQSIRSLTPLVLE